MNDIIDYIRNDIGLMKNDRIVVGVSGGPDSMALLDILNTIKSDMNLVLICAHVNHNKRKESDQEQEDLHDYCTKNNIIFECIKVNEWGDDNFHNEARTLRYNFFEELVNNYGAKYLMTAHHADDLIETILMRIVRGSTLKGYSGFARVVDRGKYKIVRPLITKTKDELLKYVQENNIKYAIDSSNNEDHYTRNRYRHTVIPFLKKEDPNVHKKFLKFSETLLQDSEFIDNETKKVFNKVVHDGIIDIRAFLELDRVIGEKIIYNIFEKIYGDDLIIVSDVHVMLILDLIKSNKVNSIVHLPNNVVAVKAYNEIMFDYFEDKETIYEIELYDKVNLPNGKNIDIIESSSDTSNYVTRLKKSEIKLPLYVRNRKNGDRIAVKGLDGTKKVNEIFINSKIKTSDRNNQPIVLDALDNIVWIPGIKKSKYDKDIDEDYDIILRYY